jgi:hypothetical protein
MIGTVVISLGVLVSLGVGVIGVLVLRREHEAFKSDTSARFKALEESSKEMAKHISNELTIVRREIHESENRISDSGEERSVKIHDRLNEVLKVVSRLEGRVDVAKR